MSVENIIIVYDYAFINGGAANIAIQSAIALSEQTNKHIYYFAASGSICKELKQSKVKCTSLNLSDINTNNFILTIMNGIWNFYTQRQFNKFLRSFSPTNTVVHVHGWTKALSPSVIYESTKRSFITYITLHDYFAVCPNGGFYNYQCEKICDINPMSMKCILCNCDKRSYLQKIWRIMRQFIQDCFVRKSKIINFISLSDLNESVVAPFLASNKINRISNFTEAKRSDKDNSNTTNRYIYVGRISEEKGVVLFCEAISRLKYKHDISGTVIGDGPLYNKLKNQYKNVEFTGWKTQEEIFIFMRTSRALIFPSKWYEGAPLIIIEALTIGLPCIVSNCTSAIELIFNNFNGFVFKTQDINSLLEKIELLQNNETYNRIKNNIITKFDLYKYTKEKYVRSLLLLIDNPVLFRGGT
jgi:glycosyltransferase involved in cell wall biosynthesis